jgi:phospholipase C
VKSLKGLAAFLLVLLFMLSGTVLPSFGYSDLQTVTPIQHVVYVMMENHSFDNIFGTYPGNLSNSQLNFTEPTNLLSNRTLYTELSAVPPGTFNTTDPTESVYAKDLDGGKMDGFAKYSGPQSMTYYTQSQLAIEWDWAEEFGLDDNYFASVLSETTPNRLYSLAGFSPVNTDCDNCPPPYINASQTIFSQLSSGGVSWGYFAAPGDDYYNSYPLDFFQGFQSYSGNVGSWNKFAQDLAGDSLPAVSFVSSLGYTNVDQHPPDNVTYGEDWLLGIVNEVMKSSYWGSTAIFINYDEGGGYFDQVPPPALDGIQLGFRVPLIVISSYSKEDYVSHTELNHGSILAFIEYNWNLPPLNSFVGDSNIPLDFFDFSSSPRAPIVLSNSSQYPDAIQIPFSQLPYARSGSSSVTLYGSSSTVNTSSFSSTGTTSTTQTSGNNLFSSATGQIILAIIVLILIASIVGYILRPKKKKQKYYGYKQ